MSKRIWDIASDEVQVATFRDALFAARGNITIAAENLHMARCHATRLVKKFDLRGFAFELRRKDGFKRRSFK